LGVAAIYFAGRIAMVAIVATRGGAPRPWPRIVGWPFLIASAVGLAIAAVRRRTRILVVLVAAIAVQAAAFYVLATRNGADTPYMALKMVYLAIYPLAVCGALALAAAFAYASRFEDVSRRSRPMQMVAWGLV